MDDDLTPEEQAIRDEEDAAWDEYEWRKGLAEHDRWRKRLIPFAMYADGTTVLLDPVRPLVTGGTGGSKSSVGDVAQRLAEEAAS